MKRTLILLMLIASCTNIWAQDSTRHLRTSLLSLYSPAGVGKVAMETTTSQPNTLSYSYIEIGSWGKGSAEAYGQFFVEHKWSTETPLAIHAEYRGSIGGTTYDSTTMLGVAYSIGTPHGYISFAPLAMWRQFDGFGANLSIAGGWEWKHIQAEHYTDIWRGHRMTSPVDLYSQSRVFYKVSPKLSVGVIGTIYWNVGNAHFGVGYLTLKLNL